MSGNQKSGEKGGVQGVVVVVSVCILDVVYICLMKEKLKLVLLL
jgi:hypothetical protein